MARQPPTPEELANIYIDESSQTQNQHLLLGGLIVHKLSTAGFDAALSRLRLPELPAGELKWAKVSRTKLAAYKRVVDGFWDDPDMQGAHFHAVVVDTHRQDHGMFNEGNAEVGFNKEVYQLANKFARLYGNLFHLYLDNRDTTQSPERLRLILNRGRKKMGDKRDWPFRRCHFRDSKACLPLQLVDIFIGAIGYHLNDHLRQFTASPAKCDLAQRVLSRAKIGNPRRNTSVDGKFTIWHRKLRASPKVNVSQP